MDDLFDFGESKRRRDAGMDRVMREEFRKRYFNFILNLPRGWVGTSEDIRKMWPHPQPHHHNAWGSNWGAVKKLGLLIELPQQTQMTAKKAHARKTHLHRRA
jgi:hypothetical protein